MEFLIFWFLFLILSGAFGKIKGKEKAKQNEDLKKEIRKAIKTKAKAKGKPLPDFYEDFSKDRAEEVLEEFIESVPQGISVEGPDPFCDESIPHGGAEPHPVLEVEKNPIIKKEETSSNLDLKKAMTWSVILGKPRSKEPYTYRG